MENKGFGIATYQDTRDEMMKYRERGALRGVYLGFPVFHENYTMSLPGCSDWTGKPQSGKSEFVLELLLNTSLFYGWKHLMYVPDIGKKEVVISKLIHKLSRDMLTQIILQKRRLTSICFGSWNTLKL